MPWRHRIAIVLLLALTGLPVGATLCAMMCEPAPMQTAAHHGKGGTCEASSAPSPGPLIDDRSAPDCGTHETSLPQVATTSPERSDLSARTAAIVSATPAVGEVVMRQNAHRAFDHSVPPGIPVPTASVVVLRV